jgi:hypothetical protein
VVVGDCSGGGGGGGTEPFCALLGVCCCVGRAQAARHDYYCGFLNAFAPAPCHILVLFVLVSWWWYLRCLLSRWSRARNIFVVHVTTTLLTQAKRLLPANTSSRC